MNSIGIDLHKKTITLCVMDNHYKVQTRKTLSCKDTDSITAFFEQQPPFQAVFEATAAYEWLYQILEPLADRVLLAHPGKLRVIAESTKKSDKLDAQVLAEFLARDMIPQAYRPTPRQRQHRALVRHRNRLRQTTCRCRNQIRHLLANYNADRRDLFTLGKVCLEELELLDEDRFVLDQLWETWEYAEDQIKALDKQIKAFANKAPQREQEARAVLHSIPEVGQVTVDVVLSELGDVSRFGSAKKVVSYAGLAPGVRESAGRRKEGGITKEGSRLLRWALVEASWRIVRRVQRWKTLYERLVKRCGKKKAIVAVARHLLEVMACLLKKGEKYRHAA